MSVEKQVITLWTGTKGHIDDIALEDVKRFEAGLLNFVENTRGSLLEKLSQRQKIDDEIENELRAAVTEFKERFVAEARATSA